MEHRHFANFLPIEFADVHGFSHKAGRTSEALELLQAKSGWCVRVVGCEHDYHKTPGNRRHVFNFFQAGKLYSIFFVN